MLRNPITTSHLADRSQPAVAAARGPAEPDAARAAPAHASGTAVRRGRKLTLLAVVASLVLGIVTFGSPATASASTAPVAQACFQSSVTMYNRTYTGKFTENSSVQTQAYINGQWYRVGPALSPNLYTGCVSTQVPAGYYWRFVVNHRNGPWTYVGQSASRFMSAGYTYNLGTVSVGSVYTG